MNIFVCDKNPAKAAMALDDKRLDHAIYGAPEMLSTAMHMLGLGNSRLLKAHNQNHPCMTWIVQSKNNFRWFWHYADELCNEYKYRFDKYPEGTYLVGEVWRLWNQGGASRPLRNEMTPFKNLTQYSSTTTNDIVAAYRKELCEHQWCLLTQWTRRDKPEWHYLKKIG